MGVEPQLELYSIYSRSEAIARFGANPTVFQAGVGQWVLFPGHVLCFADLGLSYGSFFKQAYMFHWVPPNPAELEISGIPKVPESVVANYKPRPTIWLFGRWGGAHDYTLLGQLDQSCAASAGTGPRWWRLRVSPAVPWKLFHEFAGNAEPVPDHADVDAAVAGLSRPTTAQDRFRVFQTLAEYWCGAVVPADGIEESELSGVRIPDVLRWWYLWAGRRRDIIDGDNQSNSPSDLWLEDGDRLVFYVENQGVYLWAVSPDGEDPHVYMRENVPSAPWQREMLRLSEFLITVCLYETAGEMPYGETSEVSAAAFQEISRIVPPVPIPKWLFGNIQAHYANGIALLSTQEDPDNLAVWMGAKTEAPLKLLQPYILDDWIADTIRPFN
jgi:hypothetical protein